MITGLATVKKPLSFKAEMRAELDELRHDRNRTIAAIALLSEDRNSAYNEAVEALHESTNEAWAGQLEWKAEEDYEPGAPLYSPDATSLKCYLESEILPWYERRKAELAAQSLVQQQAIGEALNPSELERLGRYGVHLDRKSERTLSTLIRLQELRRNQASQTGAG